MAVLALLPPPADSTQAKVCNFETTLGTDQKICRLQIPDYVGDHLVLACALPVHHFPLVEKGNPAQEHQHVAFHFFLAERVLRILDYFREVRDHELENKDEPHSLREDVVQPKKSGNERIKK